LPDEILAQAGLALLSPFMHNEEAHAGGAVRHCRSIKGHNDVDRMDEADTSPCFLSGGSSRLLLQLPFCPLVLFAYLLFPTLVLILLAFVSHCLPPFPVAPYLFAAPSEYDAACLVVEKVSRRFTISRDGFEEGKAQAIRGDVNPLRCRRAVTSGDFLSLIPKPQRLRTLFPRKSLRRSIRL